MLFFWPKYFITANFSIFGYIIKIEVMKYFGPKNALAKYIWKVLKNRSNEIHSNGIHIRRGSPVLMYTKRLFSKNLQTWRSISKSGSKIISHKIAFGHSVPGAAQHMWTYSCRLTMAGNFKFWPSIMSNFSLQNR